MSQTEYMAMMQGDDGTLGNAELVAAYEQGGNDLRSAVAGMTPEQVLARPVPGKWSTVECVGHVADTEIFFTDRIVRTIAMDRPLLMSPDENLYIERLNYQGFDLDEQLALFTALRRHAVRILRMQPPEAWSRTAVHSESGPLTLRQLVLQAVRHLRHHLPFIAEKRAALEAGQPETYTPGATKNASDFMARRTIESHGQFFLSHLAPGVSVLDCGCGPGTISLSIAERIAPGRLVGIDREPSQIEKAQAAARQTGQSNTEFQSAGIYTLPFADNSFDRVFSHALIEHLSDPILAARQMFRVLKPGGIIGVCSPDWGGFVLAPPSTELTNAIAAYTHLQTKNGGDVNAGRQLGAHLQAAGFETIQMSARYECYDSLAVIGEYLALQLERAGDSASAEALRTWSRHDDGMFAQCWVSCVARKPLADSTRRGDDRP